MKKLIKVTNVITRDESTYLSTSNLLEVLACHILICIKKDPIACMYKNAVLKTISENDINESISQKTGKPFAYCQKYDLYANFE